MEGVKVTLIISTDDVLKKIKIECFNPEIILLIWLIKFNIYVILIRGRETNWRLFFILWS